MSWFDEQLTLLVESALQEDIGDGDHSTLSCIPADAMGVAELKIKESGMLAGVAVAKRIFQMQHPGISFKIFLDDGVMMQAGDKAFEVHAPVQVILQCERLVLNCMQRMSGIATLTNTYVQKLAGFKTKILDTRKTTPNFRLLEKEAVRIGGGYNHRMGLYDMIMLKDNHIDYAGGLEAAISSAHSYVQTKVPGLKIEVETRSIEEVMEVIRIGKVDRIMLDNFAPDDIARAVEIIDGRYETEASGGINLGNITDYAKAGVDYISVGALIHQARSLDFSLKAKLAND
ncbi:MAG: carboxylating nicotinate-nucleotide diphosphorylase [Chitinophagaceae bacterium]|nr:MAG: carboxylating nicotinate-nucleotide diphosphorylase [Chitinophagaceae bacterium]